MKILSILLCLVFILFASFQINDPDPWIWIPLYLFSAYTAFCSSRNYFNPMLLMILATAYLLGALFLFPFENFTEVIQTEQKAQSFEMSLPFIEEARESLGLLICCITNTIFMFIGFKKAKQPNYNFGYFFTQEPPQEN